MSSVPAPSHAAVADPPASPSDGAPDVAAVVVTFNRCALLTDLIESLLSQTVPLAAILVVDNASSDETEMRMRAIAARHPRVHYLRSSTNSGGSGGFARGVRAAHAAGHRWFWLMDDDVRALPDGLAGLVRYMPLAGCIHGRRRDFNGKPFFWQTRFNEPLGMPVPVFGNLFRERPSFETNVGVFEGMLVSRAVVDHIGFPDARFFITWDDAIYGWLASRVSKVLYVDHYTLERRRRQRQVNLGLRHLNDASDLYRFHTVRNRPLVRDYVQRAGVYSPFWFAVGSALILCKEAVRLMLVEHQVKGFAALWHGWQASHDTMPPAATYYRPELRPRRKTT